MLTFTMLVGLPGSGKSTYGEQRLNTQNNYKSWYGETVLLSSDKIREELYGDESIQGDPTEVFGLMRARTIENLKQGHSVIYDATNITPKSRRGVMADIEALKKKMEIDITCTAWVIATPIEVCLLQNSLRKRKVPEEVIFRMLKSFRVPTLAEGFGYTQFVYLKDEYKNCYGDPEAVPAALDSFKQNNPWHPEDSLGAHTRQVAYFLRDNPYSSTVIREAALLHDIGKPFCETKDDNGVSHYYGHANVGAYLSMGYKGNCPARCKLINYHMDAHQWEKDPKAGKKFANGEPDTYEILLGFSRADSKAVIPGFLTGDE